MAEDTSTLENDDIENKEGVGDDGLLINPDYQPGPGESGDDDTASSDDEIVGIQYGLFPEDDVYVRKDGSTVKVGTVTAADQTIKQPLLDAPWPDDYGETEDSESFDGEPFSDSVPIVDTDITQETSTVSDGFTATTFEGKDLIDTIAKLSNFNYIESTAFADGFSRKIDCFFVPKTTLNQNGCFHYIYGREVVSITISQTVSSYGISGKVEINDTLGSLSTIAEFSPNYYFAISIFNITEEDNGVSKGYMTQPYVFEIEECIPKSPDGSPSKVYQFKLKDIISSTLGKVGYGNLLLEYPGFVNLENFCDVYNTILDYAGKIINIVHNKKYYVDCTVNFIEGNADSYNELLKSVIFKELDISMDCYSLLNYIYRHAAKEIKIPEQFNGDNPGNVLIPLLLQDEIEDIRSAYRKYFNRRVTKKIIDNITFESAESPYTTNASYIRRALYAKNILMPFELAFNSAGKKTNYKSIIYENINPLRDRNDAILESEKIYFPMNGYVFSPIEDAVDIPPNGANIGLGWKNLALISDSPDGSNNLLVYFNWIYEYYLDVFLNRNRSHIATKLKEFITPATDPHFHVMETHLGLTGKEEDPDAQMFAKMNANTIILKSSDPIKEALYHVGRTIKSYIMNNSLYGFKIKGDLLRHPGEIIKINSPTKNIDEYTAVSIVGGLSAAANNHILAYTNSIIHIFEGNTFKDLIYCNKICNINAEGYEKAISDEKAGDNLSSSQPAQSSVPAAQTANS